MTAKEFLERGTDLENNIECCAEQIKEKNKELANLGGIMTKNDFQALYDKVMKFPKSGDAFAIINGLDAFIQDSETLQSAHSLQAERDMINHSLQRSVAYKKEITDAIDKVEDMRLRNLLTYHYLVGLPWEEVAKKLDCSLQRVYQLRTEALKMVEVPDKYKD